ncbi:acetyl-CoA C-acyltransferase [Marinobacter zhanjiangensis]|uniref:Acyl-CoA thiolase n=1 Tax=Marinobacter zhanjiangensis TaxID=578215 RepID=A0ABQ3AMH9_9GAMM|nr:acetyl-CoA C-acyltransferase [Marinobacter zhanjiangensis]GGY59436.1 acyl-CoA thiolase [Marinobacter zhanjiangensis]
MTNDPIVITSMARTPMGGFQGDLKALSGTDLGASALRAALQRSSLGGSDVSEVMMGNVLPAGLGQAPARQAALGAGLDLSTPCTTISKVCGSGMKATMLAHDLITVGSADIIAAGGMESMTNAPYLVPKMRNGARLGHAEMLDHMFFDGLEDAYEKGRLMGTFAEACADHYRFTREQQDDYALASLDRALKAIEKGHFRNEITPVDTGRGMVDVDEQPGKARPDKIPSLKPAFRKDGTVTPANASSISDGGAALVLMRQSEAEKRGLTPLAAIRGHSSHARAPKWFTTAPVGAIQGLMEKTGWAVSDVDLFEINEAFAVVPLAAMKELDIAHDKVNVHGGACALGHPLGASGARIIVTLLGAMQTYDLKRGVASLCIGGGEATAIALERL